ncbi:MAG: VWA domain-containing protein [Phototrophicaceae bacterium]
MDDFRFAFLPAFILLIPALIIIIRWWLGQANQAPAVLRYSDTRLLAGLPVGLRVQLRRLPDGLRVIAWLLLVIALARPQGGDGLELLNGQGLDIVMALDISDSMATADFNGLTRFDAAKDVIIQFIDGRLYDRIGLVVFAEDAFYQAPPTTDYNILATLVADVPLAGDIGLSNRTALGLGIAASTNMLRRSTAPSQVVILVTDGSNNAGEVDPISAAQAAAAFGIKIYAIGIGSIEQGDALDEPTLREVATITEGRYFNALSLDDLQNVYDQIDRLEQAPIERALTIQWKEQAWGFLIAGLVLLLIERILRHTVFQSIP